jgi:hypothetical protein
MWHESAKVQSFISSLNKVKRKGRSSRGVAPAFSLVHLHIVVTICSLKVYTTAISLRNNLPIKNPHYYISHTINLREKTPQHYY